MHVAVFGSASISPDEAEYRDALRLGSAIARLGLPVATGGYGGAMAAVSRGAVEAGGTAIGVTVPDLFVDRPGANRWVTDERPAPSLSARIGLIVDEAVAAIALPGMVGTLAELVVVWHLAQIRRAHGSDPLPVAAVGSTWEAVVGDLEARFPTGRGLITRVGTIDEAIRWLAELPEDA